MGVGHLKRPGNAQKLALITFFSSLYFYIHVNTLYLQSRSLNLLEIRSLESIIILTIFLAEVPTGVIADRIGRKWSVVLALAFQALGEILYLFSSTFPAFVFIAVLAGIGFAFLSGATLSAGPAADAPPPEPKTPLCPCCSAPMKLLRRIRPSWRCPPRRS